MRTIPGLILAGLALLTAITAAVPARAVERVYYIAAEETRWDYVPQKRDMLRNAPFSETQALFVTNTTQFIGATYLKAVYREYTDGTFRTRRKRPAEWAHLGYLGPVLRAEVGDTIIVHFMNKTGRPYSMHPHGVFYEKSSEGAPYADGTSGKDKADDSVPPGGAHTYVWKVPERAGPGPNDPDSIAWLYHSHVNAVKDTNTGLVGAIIVTAKGRARIDGSPKGVDREFVTLFTVTDENQSWYLDRNIRAFAEPEAVETESEEFAESNLMHGVNGYLYGNMPGLEMKVGERVRWHVLSLGTEVDLHTPHWHGSTLLVSGKREDVVQLMPAARITADMIPDAAGIWLYHCHVNDHITAGMSALYRVTN